MNLENLSSTKFDSLVLSLKKECTTLAKDLEQSELKLQNKKLLAMWIEDAVAFCERIHKKSTLTSKEFEVLERFLNTLPQVKNQIE